MKYTAKRVKPQTINLGDKNETVNNQNRDDHQSVLYFILFIIYYFKYIFIFLRVSQNNRFNKKTF
jgi:hypothetical protein